MSNTINWGKIYEKTAWGIGVVTNTISWGKIYANLAGLIPSFSLNFATISDDFTFTRSSFATRVNEFGLIETVTDLGSDLVRNGDFEELGSELVTNGSFDTDSDWTLVSGATISDSTLNYLNVNASVSQSITLPLGTVKIEYTISNYTSGRFRATLASNGHFLTRNSSNGTYSTTVIITNTNDVLRLQGELDFTGSIDNVSVKQVDPNDEWSKEESWIIADGKATSAGGNAFNQIFQSGVMTIGATYKLRLNIDLISGQLRLRDGSNIFQTYTTVGNNEVALQFTAASSTISFQCANIPFVGSIDNVSVQEVLEDDVPRIDYTGSTFDVPVLGDELVDYSAIGSPTGGWSLVDGKWFFDDTTSGNIATDIINVVVGEQYEVTVDISIESGNANFRFASGNAQTVMFNYTDFADGVTTFISTVTGVDGSVNRLYAPTSLTDNPFTLNSISVKKVTAYTTTDKGSFLLEPQSTNLLNYSEDFSQWGLQGNTLNLISGVAPDGSTSVYELTSVSSGKLQSVVQGLAINTTYTFSFYVKQTSATTSVQSRILSLTGGSGGSNLIEVNYQDQLITDEWVRITHIFTTDDTLGNYIVFVSNALTVGESLQFWGAQVEELPYATSYIPTNGSIVTRSAETCVDATPTINSEEGVIYFEGSTLVSGGGLNKSITLSDGSTNNQIQLLWFGANDNFRLAFNGTPEGFSTKTITNIGQDNNNKIAVRYSSEGAYIFINGSQAGELVGDFSFPIGTLTELDFDSNGTTPFYGNTKDLKIYDKALSDEELIKITTI